MSAMFRRDSATIVGGLKYALFLLIVGCGAPAPPPTPPSDQVTTLVKLSLDAWREGKSMDAIKPQVEVVDPRWQEGLKLESYEVGATAPEGYDLRCDARLSLVNANGEKFSEDAVYTVSVKPPRVIRGAEGW